MPTTLDMDLAIYRQPMSLVHRSGRAFYLQVADSLREKITSGALRAGDRLGFEAQLAHDYGVGVPTIKKALAVLRQEGLILTDRQSGSTVRQAVEYTAVPIDQRTRVRSRMPTTPERVALDIDEGVPLLVIIRPDQPEELYPADRYETAGDTNAKA